MSPESLKFDYQSYQERIEEIDKPWFDRKGVDNESPYKLNWELGPCPFEGNLIEAKVILLLANPHLTDNSIELDHKPVCNDGWGLWGLDDTKGYSVTTWWRSRLKSFVNDQSDNESWRKLSLKVASIQVIPWASRSFPAYKLPSTQLMLDTVKYLAEIDKDKVFIVCRQRNTWEKALVGLPNKIYYLKNIRCSYITKNNIRIDDTFSSELEWDYLRRRLET